MKSTTWLLILAILLVACGSGESDSADDPASMDWEEVLAAADGQTVNWYMWGGADNINAWIEGYVADNVKEQYNITLKMVPLVDTADAVNKVLNEQQAGRDSDGSVDMIWINGENFATMKQADLLYGPWAEGTPNNAAYINWDDASVAFDLGLAVDGYESPYGKAQFVMVYDSAKAPDLPTDMDGFLQWVQDNPGRFTYPALPDFTGYAFVLSVCYHELGGHDQYLGEFDQAKFDADFTACWDKLNAIEPFLWRDGETYPETLAQQDDLYANGEVWLDMKWGPAEASAAVAEGMFPPSTRTFVFDEGTPANTHYLAIPYNSPNKAAAMVLADFILSPEAQLSKKDINNWGDFPAIDLNLVEDEMRAEFEALPLGEATLTDAELAAHRLPELSAEWRVAIEQGWEANVLEK